MFRDMTRQQLIDHLRGKGHTLPYILKTGRGGIDALVKLAESGKTFAPSSAPVTVATVPQTAPDSPVAPTTAGAGLMAMIAAEIVPLISDTLRDELMAKLSGYFESALDNRPREIALTVNGAVTPAFTGHAHFVFPDLLFWALQGEPVYLYGPAGSGKTQAARMLAATLSAHFGREIKPYMMSFHEQCMVHDLLGYRDAMGHTHRTSFREAWEHGGVILLDEFDRATAVRIALNMATANGECVFPDVSLKQHPDCFIVAAGNTNGCGATSEYGDATRMDGSTRDRFTFLAWPYDPALESAIVGSAHVRWVLRVQSIREAVARLGQSASDIIVTPRASIKGAKALQANPDMDWGKLEDVLIWRGIDQDVVARVKAEAR